MAEHEKRLIVVGGPNGSGKTTYVCDAESTYPACKYLGADELAAQINPASPEAVAVQAGRAFVHRLNEAIEAGDSLIVESTLSGKSLLSYCRRARDAG